MHETLLSSDQQQSCAAQDIHTADNKAAQGPLVRTLTSVLEACEISLTLYLLLQVAVGFSSAIAKQGAHVQAQLLERIVRALDQIKGTDVQVSLCSDRRQIFYALWRPIVLVAERGELHGCNQHSHANGECTDSACLLHSVCLYVCHQSDAAGRHLRFEPNSAVHSTAPELPCTSYT